MPHLVAARGAHAPLQARNTTHLQHSCSGIVRHESLELWDLCMLLVYWRAAANEFSGCFVVFVGCSRAVLLFVVCQ